MSDDILGLYAYGGDIRLTDGTYTITPKDGARRPDRHPAVPRSTPRPPCSSTPTSTAVPCPAGTAISPGETEDATGPAGVSFDAATGKYQYDWKTSKSLTGCHRLDVNLADGTTRSAWFSFTP